jgi:hypothetical protein
VIGKRSEGLLLKARPLEQAERSADRWRRCGSSSTRSCSPLTRRGQGPINTVLVKKGVRVSELRRTEGDDLRLTEGRDISGG